MEYDDADDIFIGGFFASLFFCILWLSTGIGFFLWMLYIYLCVLAFGCIMQIVKFAIHLINKRKESTEFRMKKLDKQIYVHEEELKRCKDEKEKIKGLLLLDYDQSIMRRRRK